MGEARPVLSPEASTWEGDYIAANGSSIYGAGEHLHWYQGCDAFRRSDWQTDFAETWTARPYDTARDGSWDERGVADPYVIRRGSTFTCTILGQDRARRQRLGVARSTDGVMWQKYRGNPVLELGAPGRFDETGLG